MTKLKNLFRNFSGSDLQLRQRDLILKDEKEDFYKQDIHLFLQKEKPESIYK